MRIPEIREELLAMSHRLALLAEETKRRPSLPRAKKESLPLTPPLIQKIRGYKLRYPHVSQKHMANVFKTNAGRISEALRGKRK